MKIKFILIENCIFNISDLKMAEKNEHSISLRFYNGSKKVFCHDIYHENKNVIQGLFDRFTWYLGENMVWKDETLFDFSYELTKCERLLENKKDFTAFNPT